MPPKIFFMCTHSNQGTGYGRIACEITNHLAKTHDVVYYAFQGYRGQEIEDRFIDPRIKFINAIDLDPVSPKGFGDLGIIPSFDHEQPDYLFIYNDICVCYSIINLLKGSNWKNYKVVLYVDIVYPWEDIEKIKFLSDHSDMFYVFLDCWKTHLHEINIDTTVLKHGIDVHKFQYVENAKEKLGFSKDDFLILNLNRNSYRKQLYVTIKAFLEFYKTHKNAKLQLSCIPYTEDGYDIHRIIYTECVRRGLDVAEVSNVIFNTSLPTGMTEEWINLAYNAADVGLNTSCGEGFGLTTVEHAMLDKPQIITGIPAMKETIGDIALVIEPKLWTTVNNFEAHGGEVAHIDPNDVVDALEKVYNGEFTAKGSREYVISNWSWGDKLKVLDDYFIK